MSSTEFASAELTMGQVNAVIKKIGGKEVAHGILNGSMEFKIVKENLLEPTGTSIIPATTKKFVASEKFVVNTRPDAKVKISFIGDNFRNWFGDKVEEPAGEQTLRLARLLKNSKDEPIIAELGDDKAETTLQAMFSLMEKQGIGGNGDLLTDGRANIFYVRDCSGVVRTVYVFWDGDGWFVHASSVGFPRRWDAGRRAFSRNS